METLYACVAMLAFVFLKAFQQRNVVLDHYWPIIPVSWLMFAAEAYVIVAVASHGWDIWFVGAVGTSAGIGAIAAMYLHRRIFRRKERT